MSEVGTTEVSTWGIRGHFGAGGWSTRADTTAVDCSGETADRRTDVGGGRIGGAGGAGAWGERQPGVSVTQAVPPRVAGSGEHSGGEFASGSCDGSVGKGSSAVEAGPFPARASACTHRAIVVNAFRLLLHSFAYNMVNLFRLQLPASLRSAQIETLRMQLFKIGARIRQTARCVRVHMASGWPFQNLFQTAALAFNSS